MKIKIRINPERLIRYREFDRRIEPVPDSILFHTNIDKLKEDIEKNGIIEPLELDVVKGKALLVEGNHRLTIALELKIKSIELVIVFVKNNENKSIDYYNERKRKYVKFDGIKSLLK